MASAVQSQRFGQLHNSCLGRGVRGHTSSHSQAKNGGNVNQAAGALIALPLLDGKLGNGPDPFQVGIDHSVPFVFGNIFGGPFVGHTGIIHHHIQGRHVGKGSLNTGVIAHIHGHDRGVAAQITNGSGSVFQFFHTAGGQHQIRTFFSQCHRKMRTETTGRAGNQNSLAGHTESLGHNFLILLCMRK